MKRLFSKAAALLLAMSMLLSLLTVGAAAASDSGQCGENVYWKWSGDTLTVYGTGAMWDYQDMEPDYLDYWYDVDHIVISDGVTEIGDFAFWCMENTEDVVLADSVTDIGVGAFQYCYWLSRVELPGNLLEVGDYAFLNCDNLSRLEIPESVQYIGALAYGFSVDQNEDLYRYPSCIYGKSGSVAADYAAEYYVDFVATGSASGLPFTDVPAGCWYYDYVKYAYENGLMSGTSDTTFAPQTSLTRAMFVTILGRLSGITPSYPVSGAMHFSDVKSNNWFAPYVAWAVDNGIVNGMSETQFGSSSDVTREQMATMIARYVNAYGYELPDSPNAVSGYRDVNQVSAYARNGLELMRRTGIITGDNYGNFNPKDSASRVQAAIVFMRLNEAIEDSFNDVEEPNPSQPPEETPTPSETPEEPTPSEPPVEEPGVCSITFHWNDGSSMAQTCTLEEGQVYYDIYKEVQREGYIFTGWYTEPECVNPFDLSQRICNDWNLYAGWMEEEPDPGTTDPGTTDPGTTDPGTTDPGTTDPGTTDPGTTDPGTTDPGTTDPGTTDPGTTDPDPNPGTPDPDPVDPDPVDPGITEPTVRDSMKLTVGGTTYYLGQSASELGAPEEQLTASYGFTWYVYGTGNYQNFFAAGVDGGKVVALASAGKGFNYQGMTCGGSTKSYDSSGCSVTVATDKNDGGIVHGVLLVDYNYSTSNSSTSALTGESKLNFHLTNAFRVYHNLNKLTWSEAAAKAARLHSQDMADQNYFSHDSLDGTKFSSRLTAQGISWTGCAENIDAGYRSGFAAYNGWVNSSGHRSNMLGNYTYLGVGGGYNSGSDYGWYFTQDFYR